MSGTAMKVVKHPTLDVKYSIPDGDVSRWVAQGWAVTDDRPTDPGQASAGVAEKTVAQEQGIGLLPVAGAPEPAPVSGTTPAEAPTAADVPAEESTEVPAQ